jgi:hypothetical protein
MFRNALSFAAINLVTLLSCAPPALAEEESAAHPLSEVVERVKLSGLFYLSYEHGTRDGVDFSEFTVDRAYWTAKAEVLPYMAARLTLDTSQDLEGDGRGDMEARIKYAYAKFDFGHWGPLSSVNLEAGIVHMVWLDFEQSINHYRMRDRMFMERSGLFNSADFGLTLAGGFGPPLGDEYRETINGKYAARHGSFALGVYNGTGYNGDERNTDNVSELRLTYRPLPDTLPGLQLSGLAIAGKANQPDDAGAEPSDWRTYNVFLSYEHPRGTVTAQRVWGRGNQKGSFVEPGDPSVSTDFEGLALFGEWRFDEHWLAIGGFDDFERTISGVEVGFDRFFVGVGYDLGKRNVLLLDYDRREWDDDRPDPIDDRAQLTLQVKF